MKPGRNRRIGIGAVLGALACAIGLMANAVAGVLYDNDLGRSGGIFNSGGEYGDEVVLSTVTPSASNPVVINGAYVVVAPNGYAGGGSVTLRIRSLDGPPDPSDLGKRPGPGSVLGSGSASVPAITRTTRIYVPLSATLNSPGFVVTAEFSGLSGSTVLGVMVANPPSGGSSSDTEFWANTAAGWKVQALDGSPANFGFILLGQDGADVLRAGGGSSTSIATSFPYKENAVAISLAKGSLVSFSGTQELTVAAANLSGDKLTSGGLTSNADGLLKFTGTQEGFRGFLESLQYENTSENPRAGAHVINFTSGGLISSIIVTVTAVNDLPVVALDLARGAQTSYTVNQFTTGQNPIIVPFTFSDLEGTALLTVAGVSDNEEVIKNADLEVVEVVVDAAGNGTGKLKIKQANVPTGTAYPAGLKVAILATDKDRNPGKGSVIINVIVKAVFVNKAPDFAIAGNDASKIWAVDEDGVLEVGFTLADDAPEGLTIEKSSSDPKIISAEAIVPKTRTTGVSPYFEIKPQPNQNGLVTLTLVAKDKDGATTIQVLKVSVIPVNDAPLITALTVAFTGLEFQPKTDAETAAEPLIVKIPFDVSDVDVADALTLSVELDEAAKKLLSDVQIVAATKTIRLTPRPFQSGGPAKVTLVATDKGGLKAQKEFTLTVPDLNNPPRFAEMAQALVDGKAIDALKFKVIDEKPIVAANVSAVSDKVELVSNDFKLTQDGEFWVLTYRVLAFTSQGKANVDITAKDAEGLTTTVRVSLDVAKRKTPPFVVIGNDDTTESTTVADTANNGEIYETTIGVDDLGTLAAALTVNVTITANGTVAAPVADPSKLTVIADKGSLGKVRDLKLPLIAGRSGNVTFKIKVTDSDGDFTEKTLTLTVKPPSSVNTPPVIDFGDDIEELVVSPGSDLEIPFDLDDAESETKDLGLTVSEDGTSLLQSLQAMTANADDPIGKLLLLRVKEFVSGTATITLTAKDTGKTVKKTVSPRIVEKKVTVLYKTIRQGAKNFTMGSRLGSTIYVPAGSTAISLSGNRTQYTGITQYIWLYEARTRVKLFYIDCSASLKVIIKAGTTISQGTPPTVENAKRLSIPQEPVTTILGALTTTKTFKLKINSPPELVLNEELAANEKAVYPNLANNQVGILENRASKPITIQVTDPDLEDRDLLVVTAFSDNAAVIDENANGISIIPLGGGKFSIVLKPKQLTTEAAAKAGIFVSVNDPFDDNAGTELDVTVLLANATPLVGTRIPDQVVKNNKRFAFQIPGAAFADPDPSDKDKLKLTAKLESGEGLPAGLSLGLTGLLVFDPAVLALAPPATHSIVVTATDLLGASVNSAPFSVQTVEGNNAPLVDAKRLADQTAVVGKPFVFSLRGVFSDPDGDELAVAAKPLPEWLKFNQTSLLLSGTPVKSDVVVGLKMALSASDPAGKIGLATLVLTVEPAPNRSPKLGSTLPAHSGREGKPLTFALLLGAFTDADEDDALTLTAEQIGKPGLPEWLGFDAVKGSFNGTPPDGAAGQYSIKVTASDKAKAPVSQTFPLTIAKRPAPVTLPIAFSLPKITVKESDPSFQIDLVRAGDTTTALEFVSTGSLGLPLTTALVEAPVYPVRFEAGVRTITLTFKIKDDGLVTGPLTGTIGFSAENTEGDNVKTSFQLTVQNVTGGEAAKYVSAIYSSLLARSPTNKELTDGQQAIVNAGLANSAGAATARRVLVDAVAGGSLGSRLAAFLSERFLRNAGTVDAGTIAGNAVTDVVAQILASDTYYSLAGGNDAAWLRLAVHDLFGRAVADGELLLRDAIPTLGRLGVAQNLTGSSEFRGGIASQLLGFGEASGFLVNAGLGFSYTELVARFAASPEFYNQATSGNLGTPPVRAKLTSYPSAGEVPGLVMASVDNSWGAMTVRSWDVKGNLAQEPLGVVLNNRAQGSLLIVSLVPPFGTGQLRVSIGASLDVRRDFESEFNTQGVSQSLSFAYSRPNPNANTGNQLTASIGRVRPDHVFGLAGERVEVPFSYQASVGVELTAVSSNQELIPDSSMVLSQLAGENRALVFAINPGVAGDTRITLVARDRSIMLDQTSFKVTVLRKPPVVDRDPVDVVAVSGTFANFEVRASGFALEYQWERYNSVNGRFQAIDNQTLPTYSTSESETVRVRVSNSGGVATSQSARVIRPVPPVGVVSPAEGLTANLGQPAVFVVTQVFSSYDEPAPVVSWLKLDEATGKPLAITTGVSADGRRLDIVSASSPAVYFARIQDKYSEWISAAIPLKVRTPLSITEEPAGRKVKVGQSVTLKVKASGEGPFEYQWRLNGKNLRGVFSDTYTIDAAKLTDAGNYAVVVSKTGSEPVTSKPALIEVETSALGFSDSFAGAGSISASNPSASGEGGGTSATASSAMESGEPRVTFNGPNGTLLESVFFYSMWTTWTAPAKGVVSMETAGSGYDTILSVFTGSSLGVLRKAGEDDDSGPNRTSRVTINVTKGSLYYVRVGLRSGEPGLFAFAWSFTETALTAPQIDSILPTFLGTSANAAAGNGELKLAATVSGDAPLKFQWYRSNLPLSNGDEGAPPLANAGATEATFTRSGKFSKLIGDYYMVVSNDGGSVRSDLIRIKTEGSGASRKLYKQVIKKPIEGLQPGDWAVNRARNLRPQALGVVTLTEFSGSQLLLTEGETVDPGEPNHAGIAGGASVWFSLKPPSAGRLTLSTEGETDFDTVLAVYTGTTNPLGFIDYKTLVEVASDNNSGANGVASKLTFAAEAGKEYFIAVDGVNGDTGVLEFSYKMDVAPVLAGLKDYTLKQNSAGESIQFKADDSLAGPAGLSIRLLSSDPSLIDPAKVVVSGSGTDRTILLTPEFNKTGTATLTLLVEDGANVTSGNFKVTVEAVNQQPEASDLNLSLAEDTAQALVLAGRDPEGKALTFTVLTQPLKGKLSGTVPKLTYTASADTFGNDQFTYRVNDGALDSAPATVTLSVVTVNDSPTISTITDVAGKAGTPTESVSFTVGDIDSPLDSISVLARSDTQTLVADAGILVSGNGAQRTVTVYPSAAKTGKAVITLTAIDDGGATATTSFGVTIASTPPVISTQPQAVTVLEGEAAAFFVQARGTGPFTFQWRKDGQDVTSRTGGTLSFAKVTLADAGKYSVVVKSSAGTATSDEAVLKVTTKVVLPTKLTASLSANGFVLRFTSAAGPYRVQGSTDLLTWQTLASENTATGVIDYTDKDTGKNPMRFYRVIEGQ